MQRHGDSDASPSGASVGFFATRTRQFQMVVVVAIAPVRASGF
jgi:hypothetical protein